MEAAIVARKNYFGILFIEALNSAGKQIGSWFDYEGENWRTMRLPSSQTKGEAG
jgi:hypothetical protein